ncbi:MAG: hypothetical protein PHQ59_05125 [Candidatus Daviesbacteria bacterium]|nr:hypothetical protein [Candidatus Daviesbacteria bacterium]
MIDNKEKLQLLFQEFPAPAGEIPEFLAEDLITNGISDALWNNYVYYFYDNLLDLNQRAPLCSEEFPRFISNLNSLLVPACTTQFHKDYAQRLAIICYGYGVNQANPNDFVASADLYQLLGLDKTKSSIYTPRGARRTETKAYEIRLIEEKQRFFNTGLQQGKILPPEKTLEQARLRLHPWEEQIQQVHHVSVTKYQ